MELDIQTKQQLTNLLAKPEMVSDMHVELLTDLVNAYPFYQPLHLLLAKATQAQPNNEHQLATASLYNGGRLTYRMMFSPETFATPHVNDSTASSSAMRINDEQETFEEIAELLHPTPASGSLEQEEVFEEITELDPTEFESMVSSDFFAFETQTNTPLSTIVEEEQIAQPEEYNLEAEAESTLSKYDDDKLPYTFLWWLAKTRKEHEQLFQPYVTPKQVSTVQQGELQHQYVEHIFHLQSPFNISDEARKGPINRSSNPLIDSFIKNDPQIKAPKPEQLNTENKAKKSAEDNYDLVSETLAAIYIEQMLYHKAIDTYEKLSLKFPEKSRYFADLIQSLEKKI